MKQIQKHISYITEEIKQVLHKLPAFSDVAQWSKRIGGILNDFTLINVIVFLVYGRDKCYMQSLLAFKSLKAYRYFCDEYVRNVWVHQCCSDNKLMLKVLYFQAYVYHSYSSDAPLEVFASLNADNEDEYSAKCSCVTG